MSGRDTDLFPCPETSGQRTRAAIAKTLELERHTGARGFLRSCAEQDDFTVLGQISDVLLDPLGGDPNCRWTMGVIFLTFE